MKRISILGCSGSIGRQCLSVVDSLPGRFKVEAIAGGSNISMMDVQSAWMTALITGKLDTPSETEMRHDIRAEQEWSARRYPDRPRYGLELDPVRYRAKVAEEFQAPMA